MATRSTGRGATANGTPRTANAAPEQSARSERPERQRNRPAAQSSARLNGIRTLFHDTVIEIKKVSWPDTQTTRNLTIVVIGISIALGALLGGIDAFFARVWQWIP
jgi:preprotein translocase subunit SecE